MRLASALAFTLLLGGCSAIVSLSDDDIRCVATPMGGDPCPDGRQCRGGFCVLIGADSGVPDGGDGGCVPGSEELCGGGDEDCDGMVDEGQDQDMDGFTWCGGGMRNMQDCDDNDPTSHPGSDVVDPGIEVCDGADNDCDGMIDEDDGSGSLCTGGLTCIDRVCADAMDCSLPSVTCQMGESCDFAMSPPRCVTGGCMDDSACTSPQICNMETGACVTPAAIGDPCNTDKDCTSPAICVMSAALGVGGGGRVCSQPCCADGQCPGGSVCWASGTGAELCAPPSLVMAGPGEVGASCASGSACRSGVCEASECLANCGTDADCSGGTACVAVTEGAEIQFACGESGGSIVQGDADLYGDGCTSRLASNITACLGFDCGPVCVGSCATTADCPSMVVDLDYYCGFNGARDYDSVFAVCIPKRHSGTGENGASCSTNGGCRDFACVMGTCADACCLDSDCDGGRRCRPIQIRSQWEMHCI